MLTVLDTSSSPAGRHPQFVQWKSRKSEPFAMAFTFTSSFDLQTFRLQFACGDLLLLLLPFLLSPTLYKTLQFLFSHFNCHQINSAQMSLAICVEDEMCAR